MSNPGKAVLGTVLAVLGVAVLVVLAIGTWQLGWFVEEKNVDRRVNLDNRNKATQTAWHDQALDGIRDFRLTDPADTARRGVIRDATCNLIGRLTDPYRDDQIVTFQEAECE